MKSFYFEVLVVSSFFSLIWFLFVSLPVLCFNIYGIVLVSFCISKHARMLDLFFWILPSFCAWCILGLGFLNKLAHACILHACVGQSMRRHAFGPHLQTFTCMCIPLPRNPNLGSCFVFFAYFTCYAFVLILFHRYKSLLDLFFFFFFFYLSRV